MAKRRASPLLSSLPGTTHLTFTINSKNSGLRIFYFGAKIKKFKNLGRYP